MDVLSDYLKPSLACQDRPLAEGFNMKNKPVLRIRSVYYGLKCCMEVRFWEMRISGSYPRPDTSYWLRERGLTDPKTDRSYHKDWRVQTIISGIIFPDTDSPRDFILTPVLTSGYNRQKYLENGGDSSIHGEGHILRGAIWSPWRVKYF